MYQVDVVAAIRRHADALYNHRLPDGVGTNGVFTEGQHFPTFCRSLM